MSAWQLMPSRKRPKHVPALDIGRIKTWMFEHALPLWAQRSTDVAHGGCVEQLALDGSPSDAGFKRVRVPARQIYVYSHAYLLGWEPGLNHARSVYENFVESAYLGDGIGWAKLLKSDNQVLDDTIDLYDNAFALFALGWFYRASHDQKALDLALETASIINTNLRHPKIGFWHQIPPSGPRLQNPHMHLLEACLACLDASKEPIFEDLAREVLDLFKTNFYDLETGTLCEYYDDDLIGLTDTSGDVVEPGHQLEWAWILAKAKQSLGVNSDTTIQGLVTFAETYGVGTNGLTYNKIAKTGAILDGGSRTWPNTERIKAAVALFETFGQDPLPILNQTLDALFANHLHHQTPGLWVDAFDKDGKAIATATPTSTFYHLFLAFAEILRIAPKL
jgi:mannose/cellobiose epimerase-like protein (N-acyl-D-glucosamine 2-epimerase family)